MVVKKRKTAFLFFVIVISGLAFAAHAFFVPKIIMYGEFVKDNHIQVFYDIGNGFNEKDSVTVATNVKEHKLRVNLPSRAISSFRVDLGKAPGEIVLNRVVIKGGLRRFNLTGEAILDAFNVQNQLDDIAINGDVLLLISSQSDPYFFNSTGEIGINAGNPIYKLLLFSLSWLSIIALCSAIILLLIIINDVLKRVVISRGRRMLIFALFAALLTVSSAYNVFKIGDPTEFSYAKYDNHSTFGTILSIQSEGFKYYGLETRYDMTHGQLEQYDVHAAQSEYYLNGAEVGEEDLRDIYLSRSNIRGMFYGVLDVALRAIGFTPALRFNLYMIGSNLAFALVLLVILRWIYVEFGALSTILAGAGAFFAKYLVVAGASLDNPMMSLLLPLAVTTQLLYLEKYRKREIRPLAEFSLIFAATLLKALEGYEYMPAVMVALTAPYFYYWVLEKQSFELFIKRFIRVSLAAITAVIAALGLHFAQLTLHSNAQEAKHALLHAFFKRSYGSSTFQIQEAEALAPSLHSNVFTNLLNYIKMDVCFSVSVGDVLVFSLIFALLYIAVRRWTRQQSRAPRKLYAALLLSTVSFFAMCSTLIVFKGHSFIHVHQTARIWFVPFMLIHMGMLGSMVDELYVMLNKSEIRR